MPGAASPPSARVAVGLALGATLLAGCGGDGAGQEVAGVGQTRAGSSAQLAQCRDWVEGTDAQRQATVEDVREALNQVNSGGPTPGLPAEEAYELFERACANEFAAGFRLYKIYARGAAFGSFGE